MKKLELNQIESLQGGCFDCSFSSCAEDAAGFALGAITGGTIAGGPFGFLIGAGVGLVGGMLISASCN